jgi:hypothetical protein
MLGKQIKLSKIKIKIFFYDIVSKYFGKSYKV